MSPSMVDHNLLFGFLALQNSFLSREDLIAAVSVWLQDKSRSLESILRERRVLTGDEHELLVALVKVHLARHSGNTERALASLSSVDGIHAQLTKLGDAEVNTSLARLALKTPNELENAKENFDRSPIENPPSTKLHAFEEGSSGLRFRVLRPHARGGLGEVFVAEDTELNREVALKQIHDREADDPESRARFLMEAEITGGLEHPGIVPVYGLGQYSNGRPYYAMRFIRGDSLQEAVTAFHRERQTGERMDGQSNRQRGAGKGSLATSRAFRKLLGRFIDVCEAIEYAHARGILHRDLKPGNIMLGRYGETLVVDWGLAKSLGHAAQRDSNVEEALRPLQAKYASQTRLGSVVGTPAYMSPEQALGEVGRLDATSDVYSLGATLYFVITGTAPFLDQEMQTLLNKVRSGDFSLPRIHNPGVPRALEAICLKAMALRQSDRYATPGQLAEDIEKWLADEPVTAYPEPLLVRLNRWSRRHRALVASAAAVAIVSLMSLLVVVTLIAAYNQTLSQKNRQLDRTNSQLAARNIDLQAARDTAEAKRQEAETARTAEARARQQSQLISRYLVHALRSPDPSRDGRSITIAEVLERTAREVETIFANDPRTRAEVLVAIGRSYFGLGLYRESLPVMEQAQAIWKPQAANDPEFSVALTSDLAQAYARNGRIEDAIPLFEELLQVAKTTKGPDHFDTLSAMNNLATVYEDAGRFDEAIQLLEDAIPRAKITFGADHHNTLGMMGNLANVHQHARRFENALPILEDILRIRNAQDPDDVEALAVTSSLATAYMYLDRVDEAVPLFEKVWQRQQEKLGEQHPDTLETMQGLAHAYLYADRNDEAVAMMEETVKRVKDRLGPDHPRAAQAVHSLAKFYDQVGRARDAIPLYEEALSVRTAKLGATHPDRIGTAMSLARDYIAEIRYADAERLLLEAFEVLNERQSQSEDLKSYLSDVVQLLIDLYTAWERPSDAEAWRTRLEEYQ